MLKRASFANGQGSQIMAAAGYTVNPMRTGYETIVGHRNSELYIKTAKQDGKVTEVTDTFMVITYKDGTTDTYPLGYEVGSAAGEYHKHNRVTDLKVGDTFKLGTVVGFNDVWYARDLYNPGQVAMKTGIMTGIALMEGVDVFEDSVSISTSFSYQSRSSFIKQVSLTTDITDTIRSKVSVGSEVDNDSLLYEVIEASVAALNAENEDAADVNRLGIRQVKSNHHGTIRKIDVSYNGSYEDMSPSMLKLIKAKDKETAALAKVTGSRVTDNFVSGGKNVAPGKVKIRVYIEAIEPSIVADKFVVGNQMKCTANSVYTEPTYALKGYPIDMKFSFKSLFARMVLSLRDKLVCNQLTECVAESFVRIYRTGK